MNLHTYVYAKRLPGAAQGASSTAEFEFLDKDGNLAEFTVPANVLNTRRGFIIRAGGRVTGGAAGNFSAIAHVGAALGADLFSSSALATAGASGSWQIEILARADNTSDKIQGVGYGHVCAVAVAQAAAGATGDPETALTFSVSGTFSASNAGNAAYLDFFELELL